MTTADFFKLLRSDIGQEFSMYNIGTLFSEMHFTYEFMFVFSKYLYSIPHTQTLTNVGLKIILVMCLYVDR